MFIAALATTEPGKLDQVLRDAAEDLQARGYRLAGLVQTSTPRTDRHYCDMDVHVLPDGPTFRINQDLGAHATGCRLDPAALEQAVALVEPSIAAADALILNKFGKLEAEGRGFRDAIASALECGIPVVVGVNGLNRAAFEAFADGLATYLPADAASVSSWVRSCRLAGAA